MTTQTSPTRLIDPQEVLAAAQRDDGSGFCIGCGEEAYGVEPDARRDCESCGKPLVFGAEELLLEGFAS